jgi:hypothetical protein
MTSFEWDHQEQVDLIVQKNNNNNNNNYYYYYYSIDAAFPRDEGSERERDLRLERLTPR